MWGICSVSADVPDWRKSVLLIKTVDSVLQEDFIISPSYTIGNLLYI